MSQNLAEQAPRRYDDWYATPAGARVAKAEESLLAELLDSLGPVEMVLDVGCGTGHFTRWLAVRGIKATGLDLKALSRFRPSRCRHARIVTPWGPEKWLDRNLADRVEGATLNTTSCRGSRPSEPSSGRR